MPTKSFVNAPVFQVIDADLSYGTSDHDDNKYGIPGGPRPTGIQASVSRISISRLQPFHVVPNCQWRSRWVENLPQAASK